MKARTIGLIYVLFTLSGFAGLIYESLWSRYLKLLLGHSSYGQILTLIIFMGGLGVGSFLGGRWASRLKQPLLLYAGAEALIGIGALGYHSLFLASQQGLFQLLGLLKLTGPAALICKTLVATLITAPWAIALGITFPALAIALLKLSQDSGRNTLPWLYFSNSLGGAAGILSASYWLVPTFGTPGTLILAGFVNLLLAAVFYLLARSESAQNSVSESPVPPLPALSSRQLLILLLSVSLLTGLSSFLYEIAWIRLLSLIIGSSTHSFDLMVAAFISGLAFGGLFARRLHQSLKHPIAILAGVHLLMGLSAALSLHLYEALFLLINASHLVFQPNAEAYPIYAVFKYGLCLLLMFPASFLAGTTLPLLTWTLIRTQGDDHSHVGSVYGWNTVGAILGASVGGLVLMPVLQLKWTLLSGALVDLGLGLILLAVLGPGLVPLVLTSAVCGLVMLPSLLLQFNGFTLSSGRFRNYHQDTSVSEADEVTIKDGRTATISFHNHAGRLTIKTNGKPDATVDLNPLPGQNTDEVTQISLAMYPINLMSKPYRAAMIGLGSGMTAHTLLGDPLLQQLEIIEIEPVMAELAKGFQPLNERVYHNPKVRMIFDDAKSYFFAQQQQYELIVSEPSNPWVSGVASLFSAEFYDYIRQFLTPTGVLVQWMHTYEFNDQLFLSILKALQDHFSEVAIYGTPSVIRGKLGFSDVVILASQQPIRVGGADRDLGPLVADLARIRAVPADYQGTYLLVSGKTLQPLLELINPNSDFFPLVDNGAEQAFYTKQHVQIFDWLYNSPMYYQSLFEAEFAQSLKQRLQARIDNGELSQALGQLGQLLTAPAHLSESERISETFFALVQNFYPVLSFKEPVFKRYLAYLSQGNLQAEALQFKMLESIKLGKEAEVARLTEEIISELPPPFVQLSVIRAMAIHALQQGKREQFARLVQHLALPHPKITEMEKRYLQALSKPQDQP
ncbi:MAG: spermine synthase [Candidatus Sericytochromatia bacterium]